MRIQFTSCKMKKIFMSYFKEELIDEIEYFFDRNSHKI